MKSMSDPSLIRLERGRRPGLLEPLFLATATRLTVRGLISDAATTGGGLGGWLTARQVRRADRVIPDRRDGDRYRRLGVPAQLTLIGPASPDQVHTSNREAICCELDIPIVRV